MLQGRCAPNLRPAQQKSYSLGIRRAMTSRPLLVAIAIALTGCSSDLEPGSYPGDARGMNWTRAEGEHVVLYDFRESPALAVFDRIIGDLRAEIATRMGVDDAMAKPELFLVLNREDLRRVTGMEAAGVALSQHNALVVADRRNRPNRLLIRHELTHLMAAALLPAVDEPIPWVSEGLATWTTPECAGHSHRAFGVALLEADLLPTRAQLEGDFYALGDVYSYSAAASLVDFAVESWGRDSIPVLWQESLAGLEEWSGVADAYSAWIAYLGETPAKARTLDDLAAVTTCAADT